MWNRYIVNIWVILWCHEVTNYIIFLLIFMDNEFYYISPVYVYFFFQIGSLNLVHPRISHENINNEFLVLLFFKNQGLLEYSFVHGN